MQAQFKMPDVLPYHAQWDITFGCNFRCTFCLTASGQRRPNELSTKNARTLIDKLYDEGIWFLKIMGGEPFFRRDTISLLEYAARKGMILSFSTNASLIDQDKASALADLRNSILYIQMSLYGENAARYHEVTGSAGNFERALKGLNSLVENGLDVCILTVATERNTSQIPAFYDIARRSGAKEFRLTTEIPLGRSARKRHIEMPSAPSILSTLIASLKTIKASMSASDPPVFLDARPLLGTFLHRITNVRSFYENCSAATTMLYIDPTGEVLPCPFLRQMPTELARRYAHIAPQNIMTKTFKEVWDSGPFRTFRSYYNPKDNLFTINDRCKYFGDSTCIPCAVTPCNCMELIRLVRKETAPHEIAVEDCAQDANAFKSC